MARFVCDECGTVENTALGIYWSRNMIKFKDETKNNKALCSACSPTRFSDGTPTRLGQWHGKFERRQWDGKQIMENR